MPKILIVMSAADTWRRTDGSDYPTGYWAEELAAPYRRFVDAGYEVDFASPGGVLQPLDQHSADPAIAGEGCAEYVEIAQRALAEYGPLKTLSGIDPDDYDGVLIPGGHGPVVDLYEDRDLGRILRSLDDRSALIGAVCHGPAGLLSAMDADGTWRFAGRRMSAFTDEEERMFGTADGAPWLLASTLRERGGQHEGGAPYQSFTIRDGNLFTGQNPASSAGVAEEMVAFARASVAGSR